MIAAVRNGKLKEADLDERVGELVDAVLELTSGKKLTLFVTNEKASIFSMSLTPRFLMKLCYGSQI